MNRKPNTVEQAIQIILKAVPRKGFEHPTVTNEELVGVKAHDEIDQYGIDGMAHKIRIEMQATLENEHGLGLVPDDYHGTWRILPVEQKAAHVMCRRLEKLAKLCMERPNGNYSTLRETAINYSTNPHISEQATKDLDYCERGAEALELITAEIVRPRLERMNKRISKYDPQ